MFNIDIGTKVVPIVDSGSCYICGVYEVVDFEGELICLSNTKETIWIDKHEYYNDWEEVY